jgi:hypothetical protein
MQWKFVQPLKQPWSGQSKTGSMQIFDVHELGPPSSDVVPELEPESGSVNGGSMKPLLLALPAPLLLLEEGAAPSSGTLASSDDTPPPSSPDVVASSPVQAVQPPLLLPLPLDPDPLPDPPLEPELLAFSVAPLSDPKPCRASATLPVHPTVPAPNNPTRTKTCLASALMAEIGILTERRGRR